MPTIIDSILEKKKSELIRSIVKTPVARIRKLAEEAEPPRDFLSAISGESIACIAEIKRASPSKGVLTQDYNPPCIARDYASAGAHAISALTEVNFFMGYPEVIHDVKSAVPLPVLRKDFIFDEYQVFESRALGADAILLIAGILDSVSIIKFINLSHSMGMDCLVECHNEDEIGKAVAAGAEIIGINNRNLETFETSIETSFRLRKKIPEGKACVSESGIRSYDEVYALGKAGYDAVLVGEQIIASSDRTAALRKLLNG